MFNAKQVARLDVLLSNSETDKKQVRDFVTGLLKFGSKNEESPLSTAMVLSFPLLHRIVPACHRRELPMEYAVFYHPFWV